MITKRVTISVFLSMLALALAATALADVSVPNVIGDHMVLQQGMKAPIWGKADPGEAVVVKFGDAELKTTACPKGRWMVRLPKMKAGGPYEMTIKGAKNTLTLTDILVGEVWVGSGQSNMQMSVRSSNNADQEIAAAKYPEIRLCSVERKVAGEPQDNCTASWTACTPESVADFSAVAYFFGRELHKDLNVPVGLIHTSWGGTPAEAWTSRPMLEADPDLKVIVDRWDQTLAKYPQAQKEYEAQMAEWEKAAAAAKAANQPEPKKPGAPAGPDHPHRTSGLYNAMIAPLVPFGIKGAIWYQGESNAGRAYQYRKLFPAMITDWRNAWGEGNFPFLFVQLANFTPQLPEPGPSDWAELREAQLMTMDKKSPTALKNTGMAVIIDIGDAADIHPKNKQDVGKRLALNALANTYKKPVAYSGPLYRGMKIKGSEAVLRFDHADGGLTAKGGELKGFAIAGEDKKFVWAKATIADGKIVVSSDKVAKPVAVRYAWANNPDCNLYNGAGLPASPFRTDDWRGVTFGKN